MNNYYVYGLFDQSENCFYIGKGRDRRMYNHRKNFKANKITNYFLYCKLKSLQNKNEDFKETILLNDLSEEDALIQEKILIEKYGRKINGGILCNVLEGGTQPPSVDEIKKIYGEDFYEQSKLKQIKGMKENTYNRGLKYKEDIEKLLKDGELIKDISNKLKISRNLVSKYIKLYELKYDDTKKKELELQRLEFHRNINSQKIKSRSKTYTIVSPEGDITITRKIFKYCKENNLDYRNLRNTYNNIKKDGTNSKHKNFYILKEE